MLSIDCGTKKYHPRKYTCLPQKTIHTFDGKIILLEEDTLLATKQQ